jgi:hypothetical protein
MKNSFLSRLALPGLMSLILLSPAIARADLFDINVTFPGGVTGSGSFNTDGTCLTCLANTGQLSNFVFTIDDDTFTNAEAVAAGMVYYRLLNTLGAETFGGGDVVGDTIKFGTTSTPGTTLVSFVDTDDPPGSVAAVGTVSAVPEPTSLVLLAGVIGSLVFGLTRRFGKKAATH